MDRIKIAVIDSGIADEIKDPRVIYKRQLIWDYLEEKVKVNSNATDYNGHGTMVVETILSICPMADIYIIKVLGISGTTSGRMLMEAMKYAGKSDAHLIVLASSIVGSKKYLELEDICSQIIQDNKVLIAAVENGKERSTIANYDNVIGVIGSADLGVPFCFHKQAEIQMICDSTPIIVKGRKGIRQVFKGNSKATAVAAGWIANMMMQNGIQIDRLFEVMEKESSRLSHLSSQEDKNNSFDAKRFCKKREEYYAYHDAEYQKFIYLLCEFLNCDDVLKIRRSNLMNYKNREWIKDIDAFFDLVEERLKVKISNVDANALTWAYVFYEKYLKHKEDKEDEKDS